MILPSAASRADTVPSAAPTKTRPLTQTGAVRSPPGKRCRHTRLALLPMPAATLAVPAELARSIGQSSAAAGVLDAGAAQARESAAVPSLFSGERGAMENVP